jgi:hypothetical protein
MNYSRLCRIAPLSLIILLFPLLLNAQVSADILYWEKDIRQFEKLDSIEKDPASAILFTGSSSIRLWSGLQKDMAPFNVIRRGYGGAKLSDFDYYAKRIIYPHQFSALVLFVANDITGSPSDKSPAAVAALFKNILSTIRAKYPLTPVFWIQITPCPSRWNSWDRIQEANKLVEEVCNADKNCWFIKTSDSFLGTDGLPKKELFRDDMLHLNDSGYQVWTRIIKESLTQKLKNN